MIRSEAWRGGCCDVVGAARGSGCGVVLSAQGGEVDKDGGCDGLEALWGRSVELEEGLADEEARGDQAGKLEEADGGQRWLWGSDLRQADLDGNRGKRIWRWLWGLETMEVEEERGVRRSSDGFERRWRSWRCGEGSCSGSPGA